MAEYLIGKRLMFKKGEQRRLILGLKKKFNLRWRDLAQSLSLSLYTIRINWAQEKTTIPYHQLNLLLTKYPYLPFSFIIENLVEMELPSNWGQSKGGKISSLKTSKDLPINLPHKNNLQFSEFIGVLLGDGHVSLKGIEISLEYPAEKEYSKHVTNLIFVLFGRTPIIRFKKSNKSVIYLILNSKRLVYFLNKLGIPSGNKVSNRVKIPKFILQNKSLLKSCIRGLVDTDGGIFSKQAGYSRCLIEFTNYSQPLLSDFTNGLSVLGFTPSNGGNHSTRIQKQNEVDKYVNEIGFSNSKNTIRYYYIKKFGYIPKRTELRQILAMRV